MVLGIGTDIIDIQRIRAVFEEGTDSFFERVYTRREREQASERPDPVYYFSTRFAGKEAVFKCLSISATDIRLDEIEILDGETGQPRVTLTGNMKERAERKGVRSIFISLSYENDHAVAVALAQE